MKLPGAVLVLVLLTGSCHGIGKIKRKDSGDKGDDGKEYIGKQKGDDLNTNSNPKKPTKTDIVITSSPVKSISTAEYTIPSSLPSPSTTSEHLASTTSSWGSTESGVINQNNSKSNNDSSSTTPTTASVIAMCGPTGCSINPEPPRTGSPVNSVIAINKTRVDSTESYESDNVINTTYIGDENSTGATNSSLRSYEVAGENNIDDDEYFDITTVHPEMNTTDYDKSDDTTDPDDDDYETDFNVTNMPNIANTTEVVLDGDSDYNNSAENIPEVNFNVTSTPGYDVDVSDAPVEELINSTIASQNQSSNEAFNETENAFLPTQSSILSNETENATIVTSTVEVSTLVEELNESTTDFYNDVYSTYEGEGTNNLSAIAETEVVDSVNVTSWNLTEPENSTNYFTDILEDDPTASNTTIIPVDNVTSSLDNETYTGGLNSSNLEITDGLGANSTNSTAPPDDLLETNETTSYGNASSVSWFRTSETSQIPFINTTTNSTEESSTNPLWIENTTMFWNDTEVKNGTDYPVDSMWNTTDTAVFNSSLNATEEIVVSNLTSLWNTTEPDITSSNSTWNDTAAIEYTDSVSNATESPVGVLNGTAVENNVTSTAEWQNSTISSTNTTETSWNETKVFNITEGPVDLNFTANFNVTELPGEVAENSTTVNSTESVMNVTELPIDMSENATLTISTESSSNITEALIPGENNTLVENSTTAYTEVTTNATIMIETTISNENTTSNDTVEPPVVTTTTGIVDATNATESSNETVIVGVETTASFETTSSETTSTVATTTEVDGQNETLVPAVTTESTAQTTVGLTTQSTSPKTTPVVSAKVQYSFELKLMKAWNDKYSKKGEERKSLIEEIIDPLRKVMETTFDDSTINIPTESISFTKGSVVVKGLVEGPRLEDSGTVLGKFVSALKKAQYQIAGNGVSVASGDTDIKMIGAPVDNTNSLQTKGTDRSTPVWGIAVGVIMAAVVVALVGLTLFVLFGRRSSYSRHHREGDYMSDDVVGTGDYKYGEFNRQTDGAGYIQRNGIPDNGTYEMSDAPAKSNLGYEHDKKDQNPVDSGEENEEPSLLDTAWTNLQSSIQETFLTIRQALARLTATDDDDDSDDHK